MLTQIEVRNFFNGPDLVLQSIPSGFSAIVLPDSVAGSELLDRIAGAMFDDPDAETTLSFASEVDGEQIDVTLDSDYADVWNTIFTDNVASEFFSKLRSLGLNELFQHTIQQETTDSEQHSASLETRVDELVEEHAKTARQIEHSHVDRIGKAATRPISSPSKRTGASSSIDQQPSDGDRFGEQSDSTCSDRLGVCTGMARGS